GHNKSIEKKLLLGTIWEIAFCRIKQKIWYF
ncbi:MAG: hypothetical protein ACI9L9_001426, partial [Marivirga sp.]